MCLRIDRQNPPHLSSYLLNKTHTCPPGAGSALWAGQGGLPPAVNPGAATRAGVTWSRVELSVQ